VPAYVYGIVEGRASAPAGAGIAGSPLRVIPGDGAGALVSTLSARAPRLGRGELLDHARVLTDALAGGTVLPMRFGVVMDGPRDVRERLLGAHAEELRAQLERFRDKVEVQVRATYDEDRLVAEVIRESSDIARRQAGVRGRSADATYYERIGLGESVAQAIERKRNVDARDVVEALSQAACAVEVAPPAHERVVVSASFLVERRRLKEFDAVLDAFAEGQGGRLRFRCTGPLPPHSFVKFTGPAG
jgi:Gas vesicle synthesis protein GvpL/GvpF